MRRSINDIQTIAMDRTEGAPPARTGVPFGAYLLARVMGTLAFFATVSVLLLIFIATPPFPLPLWVDSFFLLPFAISYLILATLFSFLWPDASWKWGLWLSLPCVFAVILIHLANTPSGTGLLSTIMVSLLVVLFPACACGLLGKRFAPCDQLIGNAKEGFGETPQGASKRGHFTLRRQRAI